MGIESTITALKHRPSSSHLRLIDHVSGKNVDIAIYFQLLFNPIAKARAYFMCGQSIFHVPKYHATRLVTVLSQFKNKICMLSGELRSVQLEIHTYSYSVVVTLAANLCVPCRNFCPDAAGGRSRPNFHLLWFSVTDYNLNFAFILCAS